MHQPEIEEQEDNSCGNITKNECLNKEERKKTLKRSSSATSVRSGKRGEYSYEEMKAIQSLTETLEDESKDENGYHEHEVLGPGPEAQETASAWEKCEKNPGHPTFIPVVKLTRQHLPECFQGDEDVFEFIKYVASLTVRLKVTSSNRPAKGWYRAKGIHTGTGYIFGAYPSDKPCQCCECKAKPEESRKFWEIEVSTAQHVVYDEDEGKTTQMSVFYDSEDCKDDGTMKTVTGGKVVDTLARTDWCKLIFTTCDSELGSKLEELYRGRDRLGWRLRDRYRSGSSHDLVWIVSHPHGMPKHVSFGQLEDWKDLGGDGSKYWYSADTCRGSSGGKVFGFTRYGIGSSLNGNSLFDFSIYGSHHYKGKGNNGWNVGCFP